MCFKIIVQECENKVASLLTASVKIMCHVLCNCFLLADCHYIFEVRNRLHRCSCSEIYYQCHLQSTHTNMLLELLVQIISEPCFNILRTKVSWVCIRELIEDDSHSRSLVSSVPVLYFYSNMFICFMKTDKHLTVTWNIDVWSLFVVVYV